MLYITILSHRSCMLLSFVFLFAVLTGFHYSIFQITSFFFSIFFSSMSFSLLFIASRLIFILAFELSNFDWYT